METVKIVINGKECVAEKGRLLIDVAKDNRIGIPHLCHHEALRGSNCCRLCIVEVTEGGRTRIVTSCAYPALRDMIVETNSDRIRNMRKVLLSFLRAEAPDNAYVTKMIKAFGATDSSRYVKAEGNDCVMCGLCVRACEEVGCSAISTVNRGTTKKIATPYENESADCIGCGSCAYVCPTECIKMEQAGGIRKIWGKEFEMLQCGVCGSYYITREQYEHQNHKKLEPTDELVCERCKREHYTREMVRIFMK